MRCLEKVERKQGDWVKFGLLVKLMQEVTALQFKVVFNFFCFVIVCVYLF